MSKSVTSAVLGHWSDIKGNVKWDIIKWTAVALGGVFFAVWGFIRPTNWIGYACLASFFTGLLVLVIPTVKTVRLYRKKRFDREVAASKRSGDSAVIEVRAIDAYLEIRNVIQNVDCRASKEERIYTYATTNSLLVSHPVPPEPIPSIDENLIQRCYIIAQNWRGAAPDRAATELARLKKVIDAFNANPSLELRPIHAFTRQILPPILLLWDNEYKAQFECGEGEL